MATGNPLLSFLGNIGGNIMDVGKSVIGIPSSPSPQAGLVAGAPRVSLLGGIKSAMPAVRGLVNIGSDIGDAIEDVYGKDVQHNMKDFQLGKRIMPSLGKGYGLIHENILGPLFGYGAQDDPNKPYVDAGNDVEARDKGNYEFPDATQIFGLGPVAKEDNPLTTDPNPTFSFSPLLSDPISESQIGGLGVDSYGNEMVGSLAMTPEQRDSFDDLLAEPDEPEPEPDEDKADKTVEDEADEVMVEAGAQSLAAQNKLDPREDIDGDGIPNFLDPDYKAGDTDFSMLTGDPLGPEKPTDFSRLLDDEEETDFSRLLDDEEETDFSRLLDEEPTDFSILLDPSGSGVSNIVKADTTTDFSRLLDEETDFSRLLDDETDFSRLLDDEEPTDFSRLLDDEEPTDFSILLDPSGEGVSNIVKADTALVERGPYRPTEFDGDPSELLQKMPAPYTGEFDDMDLNDLLERGPYETQTDFDMLLEDAVPAPSPSASLALTQMGEASKNAINDALSKGNMESAILFASKTPEGREILKEIAKTPYGQAMIDRVLRNPVDELDPLRAADAATIMDYSGIGLQPPQDLVLPTGQTISSPSVIEPTTDFSILLDEGPTDFSRLTDEGPTDFSRLTDDQPTDFSRLGF